MRHRSSCGSASWCSASRDRAGPGERLGRRQGCGQEPAIRQVAGDLPGAEERQGPRGRCARCGAGRPARGLLLGGALLRHRPPRRRGGGTAMRLRREEGGRPAGRRLRLHGRPFLDDHLRQRRRRRPQPRRRDRAGVPGRFAQAETDGRVLHLAKLKADRWTGTDFSLCDDITSGMMMGICADHDQLIARSKRNQALADLTSGWTPAERAALATLQRSRVSLHRCARGERGRSIRHRPRRFRGGGGRQAGAGLFGAVGDDRGGEARLPPPPTTPRRPMRR